MENIKLLKLDKYSDLSRYMFIEEGIYKDLIDEEVTSYRIALSFELEDGETDQYPLEGLLDKYYMYVSDFLKDIRTIECEKIKVLCVELAGELDDIRELKTVLDKRVYNEPFIGDDGETYVKLVIK